MQKMRHTHQPRGLPENLSAEEVTHLLDAAGCLKYQTTLSVAFGAGLRGGEVIHLKTIEIESKRIITRVDRGEDKRDCQAMLSPALLHKCRAWRREVKGPLEHLEIPSLGGYMMHCDDCAKAQVACNSRRNKHCPNCKDSAAQRWLVDRQLLPVVVWVYTSM